MKSALRAVVVMALALLAASVAAQVHGVPASVTSVGTPGRGIAPGVPASVTSLGPRGWTSRGFQPTGIRPPGFDVGRSGHERGRRHQERPVVPIYVPYPVAYPVVPDMYTDEADQPPEEPPEPPAPTIFERRPVAAQPAPVVVSEPAADPVAPPDPPREQEPTVLIFKGGRQVEIHNFAISGDTLYELTPEYHKIPLADLDLPATIKENEARGAEFRVPPSKGS